jgi:hypothetical protein
VLAVCNDDKENFLSIATLFLHKLKTFLLQINIRKIYIPKKNVFIYLINDCVVIPCKQLIVSQIISTYSIFGLMEKSINDDTTSNTKENPIVTLSFKIKTNLKMRHLYKLPYVLFCTHCSLSKL